MTPLSLLFLLEVNHFTVKASTKSSFTECITIILHLTNFQWVLSYCVKFKPFPGIEEKPQTSQLRVLFYHYISRSLIYMFCCCCFVSEMAL